jgi:hypothetical protein
MLVQAKFRALSVEPLPLRAGRDGGLGRDEARPWGDIIRQTGVAGD